MKKTPIPRKRLKPSLRWSLKQKMRKKRTFRWMKLKRKKSPVTWVTEMAQGITLGELGQMVQVIQIKQASEAEERQAVQTICRTETNLFHSLVGQINGGRSRVAELLQKHEIPVPVTVPAARNDEMAAFDMNDFL